MQMLKKLFNSNSKYYLELDEVKDSAVVQATVKTAKKTAEAVQEKVTDVTKSEAIQEVVATAQDKLASAVPEASSATVTEEKPSKKKSSAKESSSEGKSAKNGKVAESAAVNKVSQANPKNSGASSFDPPFWVAAMNNTNNRTTNSNGQVAEQTFASDNLMPTVTTYRRRPGGSLAKFKDMAKTARTRSK